MDLTASPDGTGNASHRGYGDTFYLDEVFVKINGKRQYLRRAVDQDGEVAVA